MVRMCPICNSLESRQLKHMEMEISDRVCLPKSYDIVACSQCGFTYAKPEGG